MQNSRLPARGSLSPIQVHAAAREGKSGRAAARAYVRVCVCERVCAASLRTRVCIRGDVPLSLSGAAGRPEESAPERARLDHVPPPLRGAGCATASQGGRLGDSWSPKSGAPTLISRPGHTSQVADAALPHLSFLLPGLLQIRRGQTGRQPGPGHRRSDLHESARSSRNPSAPPAGCRSPRELGAWLGARGGAHPRPAPDGGGGGG